jgi:chromate transport protein ChrA
MFFVKAGSLTFGSGLVIVPFLEKGLVQQTGWVDQRQFLVAVALVSLMVLFRWNISNPVLVAATAVIGLMAFPLLQPTWVFVKE